MKEVKYTKTLAKIQVGVSFHMRDIWKKFYLNFKSFVWRGHGAWKPAETFRLPSSIVTKAWTFPNTVEPRFVDTCLIRTSRYYGKFSLSLGKGNTFYLHSTRLIRTRTTDTFLAQLIDSHRKSTSLMRTLHWLSTMCLINQFLLESKKIFQLTACRCS